MPGLITHYICAEAVHEKIAKDIKHMIDQHRNMYNIGAQGPDIFFYYIPGFMNKEISGIGSKMHRAHFKTFIENMANYTRNLDGQLKEAAMSYCFGYLTHYALDCAAHPYIFYKTGGAESEGKKEKIKHSAYHRKFETSIDTLMLKRFKGNKPAQNKIWEFVKTSKKESHEVAEILGKSINNAYSVKISGNQLRKSFVYMMNITRLMQSKSGRRKKMMESVEDLIIGEKLFSCMIHMQDIDDGIDYLNLDKTPWVLPWDDKVQMKFSFIDLFEKAVNNAQKMIDAFDKYLRNEININDLIKITGNNSFLTGKDCEQKLEFEFFDIVY